MEGSTADKISSNSEGDGNGAGGASSQASPEWDYCTQPYT